MICVDQSRRRTPTVTATRRNLSCLALEHQTCQRREAGPRPVHRWSSIGPISRAALDPAVQQDSSGGGEGAIYARRASALKARALSVRRTERSVSAMSASPNRTRADDFLELASGASAAGSRSTSAAPGRQTYCMLEESATRSRSGASHLIGFIETHARPRRRRSSRGLVRSSRGGRSSTAACRREMSLTTS